MMLLAISLMALSVNIRGISGGNEIKMIVDVVNSYPLNLHVIARVCWDVHQKASLVNHLKNAKRPKTITYLPDNATTTDYRRGDHRNIYVVDAKCRGSGEFLSYANSQNMFRFFQRWLIIDVASNSTFAPNSLQNYSILFDSEVMVATAQGEGAVFQLNLVYKTQTKGWVSEHFGVWSPHGLQRLPAMEAAIAMRRRNLAREPLTATIAVTLSETKFHNRIEDVGNSDDNTPKWGYRQSILLCDFMNASHLVVFTDTWGYLVNGTWNGMVGDFLRGKADMTGVPMFMTKNRLPHVTYLTNTVATRIVFVFREPPLSYQNNLFLLPFKTSVWLCLGGFVLVMLFFIYFNSHWEFKMADGGEEQMKEEKYPKFSLSDVAMMIISAITQQGSFVQLKGTVGRLVTFILFLVFLFLYTSYSASIVVLLQSRSKQIRTLKDLLESRLELGVEDTPYNTHLFKVATEPVRKAIYETKIAPRGSKPNFFSLDEGVRKLQNHPFGFNMEVGTGYKLVEKYFHEHEKCGLQEIAFMPLQRPWTSCKKDSPYVEALKLGSYRMREHGLSSRENRVFYAPKPLCQVNGARFGSVSLVDVRPPLLLLLCGAMAAVALLLVETLLRRQCQYALRRGRQVWGPTA